MDLTGRSCAHGSGGSPWVIAEISSPCRLPPTWTLLFQPDPVPPAISRYSRFCHRLHLEILRQIHSLTSQTISVSACTLNNKAMGSFFQDFFFNFTSLISMPLGALTSERSCVRLCWSLSPIRKWNYQASPMLWHRFQHPLHGAGQLLPEGQPPVYPSFISFYPHYDRKYKGRSLGIMNKMCS